MDRGHAISVVGVVAIVTCGEGSTAQLGRGVVEPLTSVEHQELSIVVGHGVVGTEIGHVTLILSLDISLREVLRTVVIAERAVEVLTLGGHVVREDRSDVGGTLQVLIVVGEHHTVLGHLEVALQVVGAHIAGPTPGSLSLLRSPVGGTTVCHASIERHIVAHLRHLRRDLLHVGTLGVSIHIGELLLVRARSKGSEHSHTHEA